RRDQPALRPAGDRLTVRTIDSVLWARSLVADRFDLQHLAGSGGMGVVYRAEDMLNGRPVALKMPRTEDEDTPRRLVAADLILPQVDHPHVVRHAAHGRTEHGAYIAMEWLEGETLAARLARGPLDIAESVALAETIAGALGAVHARGVVHRDVKPSNIFLVHEKLANARIVDFGLAR